MQAYKFYTTPKNGIIKIPKQYKNKINSNVKVILLEQNQHNPKEEKQSYRKSDLLLPPTMNTEGWVFNRDEANER